MHRPTCIGLLCVTLCVYNMYRPIGLYCTLPLVSFSTFVENYNRVSSMDFIVRNFRFI